MSPSPRQIAAEEVYTRLFGPRADNPQDPDPEFGAILRSYVFGDVFATGNLTDRQRELITVTVIASLQSLPQLRSHTGAALNAGVTPVELREAIYQLAPLLGFPRTLNAIATINEVFRERGIALPLAPQGTVTEEDRHDRGRALQAKLYGTEIADEMGALPGGFGQRIADFLTELDFGDFMTRTGLDSGTRELLVLCALAALGLDVQVKAHVLGTMRAGVDVETILAALVHVSGYAGIPNALNAIRSVAAIVAAGKI